MSLRVEAVAAGYRDLEILHRVSFTVEPGQLLVVLGRNGAGKSTTVLTVAGLLRARRGRITLDGDPIHRLPAYRRARQGLGVVLDGRRIFREQTVVENLQLAAGSRGAYRERVEEVLSIFRPLEACLDGRAGSLSGGQQQMLAVGQALMAKPTTLVLDEPSAGLAPILVKELFTALRALADGGLAVVLVEQAVEQAASIADTAIGLQDGVSTAEMAIEGGTAASTLAPLYLGDAEIRS